MKSGELYSLSRFVSNSVYQTSIRDVGTYSWLTDRGEDYTPTAPRKKGQYIVLTDLEKVNSLINFCKHQENVK